MDIRFFFFSCDFYRYRSRTDGIQDEKEKDPVQNLPGDGMDFWGSAAMLCSVGGGNDVDPDCVLPKDILLPSPPNLAKRQIHKSLAWFQIHPVAGRYFTGRTIYQLNLGIWPTFIRDRRRIKIADITTTCFLYNCFIFIFYFLW